MTTAVPRARLDVLCAGHFPGDPIVPGAYVAGLMADAAAAMLAERGEARPLRAVERCTFAAPLRPADDVVLVAGSPEPVDGGVVVAVEATSGGRAVARGRFRFA
jgi:3-hydroxymyristoyl/3-hydroxydecanoyl-(acyl carrier protein) dehydratase